MRMTGEAKQSEAEESECELFVSVIHVEERNKDEKTLMLSSVLETNFRL